MTTCLLDGRRFVFIDNWWDNPDYMYDQALLNDALAKANLPIGVCHIGPQHKLIGFAPQWLVRLTQRMASGWCVEAVEKGGLRKRAAMAVYSLPWI